MAFRNTIRDLVRTYQAFDASSSSHIRSFCLTPSQFDVLVTLGNQSEMTVKELTANTLITKGTMTGVLQRLEKKGLIERRVNEIDGRSQFIKISPKGQVLFERIFPDHMNYFKVAFDKLTEQELMDLSALLQSLKRALETSR
jgi:DNA-binding MarR family transcriptional regulator